MDKQTVFEFNMPDVTRLYQEGIKRFTMRRFSNHLPPEIGDRLTLFDTYMAHQKNDRSLVKMMHQPGRGPVVKGVWRVKIVKNKNQCFVMTKFFKDILNCRMEIVFYRNKLIHHYQILEEQRLKEFATMDGWSDPCDMFEFFEKTYRLPVDLKLVLWEKE